MKGWPINITYYIYIYIYIGFRVQCSEFGVQGRYLGAERS